VTKEQILDAIRECTRKLGRIPTKKELWRLARISEKRVCNRFGSLGQAIRDAGLEPRGPGYEIKTEALLNDWAAVARKMGKLPTKDQYTAKGTYSTVPFEKRWKRWPAVAEVFYRYAAEKGTQAEWADVLAMIDARRPLIAGRDEDGQSGRPKPRGRPPKAGNTLETHASQGARRLGHPQNMERGSASVEIRDVERLISGEAACRRPLIPGRAVYGDPMFLPGMAHEPVNELGVVFIFGMLAYRLGFVVERMQPFFPDCEALRQIQPGRWQRVGIEFEYESRNFLKHEHAVEGCDLIVCWVHNWRECPKTIEVIELKKVLRRMGSRVEFIAECTSAAEAAEVMRLWPQA
jgi:hypothetical protein